MNYPLTAVFLRYLDTYDTGYLMDVLAISDAVAAADTLIPVAWTVGKSRTYAPRLAAEILWAAMLKREHHLPC